MKRVACVLASIILFVSALRISAFADTSVITLSKSKIKVGSYVVATIRYAADYKMYAIDATLTYNSAVLQYVSGGTNQGSVVKIVEALSGEKSNSFDVVFKAIAEGPGLISLSAQASGEGDGMATAGVEVLVDASVSEGIPGDINGDNEVDNKDLTRLFQYLSNWDVTVNEMALDVNGDGYINNKDLTRLFRYLSEWDVEIFG